MSARSAVVDRLNDPKVMGKFHGWATVFWLAAAPPSMIFLKDSVPYLVGLSVYAVVTGHWSSWQATSAQIEVQDD